MRALRTLSLLALVALLAWGAQSADAARVDGDDPRSSSRSSRDGRLVRDNTLSSEGQLSRDERLASAALERLARVYRHLDGVTVEFGATPNGEEAVSYYERGRIVIDPAHEAGVNPILEHEIWHIIDWRDNGRLDWGEQVPPRDAERFLR